MSDASRLPDWHFACAQVAIDFAVAIDHEDFERVASLFTEDGVLDRFGQLAQGRAAILRWLKEERPKQLIRHTCSNFSGRLLPSAEVEGSTYFTAYRAMGAPTLPVKNTTPLMVGEWHDLFAQTAEGWRIKQRSISAAFVAAD